MDDFFKLKSSAEALDKLRDFLPLQPEFIALNEARGRVLAQELPSPENLPPFNRSTMDGFAVRARDTFGCSESEPALLEVIGEIKMGQSGSKYSLQPGQAIQIWTGGELPAKADSVVMVEYTRFLSEENLAVFRPVAPGENVLTAGEDYSKGDTIALPGHVLRPQDLGVFSGLGITDVPVYRRPIVGILSTGDELVHAEETPPPGKIRDVNSTTLCTLVEEAGGVPKNYGICGDDFDDLCTTCSQVLAQSDIILLSGGSSVGRRDYTLKVFEAMENTQVRIHGISVRPGKPTILAKQGNKALIGLPGHATSAMVIFYFFVRPLIRSMIGLGLSHGLRPVSGITAEPIPSVIGREEYVRVHLKPGADEIHPLVEPVYGRSGLLSTLIAADGFLPVGRDVEGIDKGVKVQVFCFPG